MQWFVGLSKLLLDELAWALEAAVSKFYICMQEECCIGVVKGIPDS